jgi:Flp pilus assembly protein TadG
MALVLPLLLVLVFGCIEVGNYFLNEHVLLKGVRDGARFAARQSFTNYNTCTTTAADVPSTLADDTKLIVRKGSLDSADPDLLPNWDDAEFTVQMTCSTTAGTTTLGGIYNGSLVGTPNVAPVVIVTARLPYRPVVPGFGFSGSGKFLNATQQAAVAGI